MGSVISKIEKEYIFKFLIQNKVNFEIKFKDKSCFAALLEQSSKELKIELIDSPDEELAFNSEIEVFFYFQNNYHTFKTRVIKAKGNIALILNPEVLLKNLQRKFVRVNINGKLQLKFKIKGDLVKLKYPESESNYYPNIPPIDADFHEISIESILKKYKEKVSTMVSMNSIKMLRNYKPTLFEEFLVLKYGKVLFIPNTHSELPGKQILSEFPILIKSDWAKYEILKNKTQAFLVNNVLSTRLKKLSQADIFSIAIFPVLYRNYVVGLIFLYNKHSMDQPISVKVMNYTFKFCRVLSYALKEGGYFKDEEANIERYIVPILDLSPGGLGFSHEDNFFEEKILLDNNYQFLLEIENRPIRILAKCVRKFKHLSKHFYGFMFLDIKRQDYDFLNDFLYNKK